MTSAPRMDLLRFGLSAVVSSSLVIGGSIMPTAMASEMVISSTVRSSFVSMTVSTAVNQRPHVMIAQSSDEMAASGEMAIRQLTAEWFAAWSPGKGSVDWDAMGQLFAQQPGDLLVFDDADGSVVVLTSWADYRATWEPFMEQFVEWQIESEGDIHIRVDGNLATSVFTLMGGGVDQSGGLVEFRQRATHIWQRMGYRWVIVHEHLTTDS
ncbi:MAG: nuclear transport factor 2 family protein [Cyanobacteria bacterium P01_F01_bin.150]